MTRKTKFIINIIIIMILTLEITTSIANIDWSASNSSIILSEELTNNNNDLLINYAQDASVEINKYLLAFKLGETNSIRLLLKNIPGINQYSFFNNLPIVMITTTLNTVELESILSKQHNILSISEVEEEKVIPNFDKNDFTLDSIQMINQDASDYNDHASVISADKLWAKDITGENVKVAILDTGIAHHKDLKDKIIYEKSFVSAEYGYDTEEGVEDYHGHGTHVAGIVAGSSMTGIAPKAQLLNLKVGTSGGYATEAGVIAAISEAIVQDVDIISISLGFGGTNPESPVNQAVDMAVSYGITVVVSAGNEGDDYQTVGSPAIAYNAIAVGATNGSNNIVDFSSRGPTYDGRPVPHVVAPGYNILSTLAADSILDNVLQSVVGIAGNELEYIYLSGTSMAAPVVSGAIALLKSQYPSLTPTEALASLMETATDMDENVFVEGAGLINVSKAYEYLQQVKISDGFKLVSTPYLENRPMNLFSHVTYPGDSESVTIPFYVSDYYSGSSLDIGVQGNITNLLTGNLSLYNVNDVYFCDINFSVPFTIEEGLYSGEIILKTDSVEVYSISLIFTIRYITRGKIYWDVFHTGSSDSILHNYRSLGEILISDGYDIDSFNIPIQESTLLTNYDILVLTDLEVPLTPREINVIRQFYSTGGSVLLIGSYYPYFEPESYINLFKELGIVTTSSLTLKNNLGVRFEDNILTKQPISSQYQVEVESATGLMKGVTGPLLFSMGVYYDGNIFGSGFTNYYTADGKSVIMTKDRVDNNGSIIFLGSEYFLVDEGLTRTSCINFAKNVFEYLQRTPQSLAVETDYNNSINELSVYFYNQLNYSSLVMEVNFLNGTSMVITPTIYNDKLFSIKIPKIFPTQVRPLQIIFKNNTNGQQVYSITIWKGKTIENDVITSVYVSPVDKSPSLSWYQGAEYGQYSGVLFINNPVTITLDTSERLNSSLITIVRRPDIGDFEYKSPIGIDGSLYDLKTFSSEFMLSTSNNFSYYWDNTYYPSGFYTVTIEGINRTIINSTTEDQYLIDYVRFTIVLFDGEPSIDVDESTVNDIDIITFNDQLADNKVNVWSLGEKISFNIYVNDPEDEKTDCIIHFTSYYFFLLDRTIFEYYETTRLSNNHFTLNLTLPSSSSYHYDDEDIDIVLPGNIFVFFIFIRDQQGNWNYEVIVFSFESTGLTFDGSVLLAIIIGAVALLGIVMYFKSRRKRQKGYYYHGGVLPPQPSGYPPQYYQQLQQQAQQPIPPIIGYCPKCGNKLGFATNFCPYCGTDLREIFKKR